MLETFTTLGTRFADCRRIFIVSMMSFYFTFEVKRDILVPKLINIINMVTGYRDVLIIVLINLMNEKITV